MNTAITMPIKVSTYAELSRRVASYDNVTFFDVGTTTIMFGAARYTPLAPDAFQLGK